MILAQLLFEPLPALYTDCVSYHRLLCSSIVTLRASEYLQHAISMASFGRITTSAVSIPTELTVAAAAFNIDFSLLKVEAPTAFNGVRDALSTRRRDDAEGGLPHMTARRLGALFDALVPGTPNLIEAYGTRVSEICSTLDNNAKNPRPWYLQGAGRPRGSHDLGQCDLRKLCGSCSSPGLSSCPDLEES